MSKHNYQPSVYILMDRLTKNYIDEIVKPLLNRIDYLEKNNEQLKVQVKYLQSLVLNQRTYTKPTISTANHMRESKISSKEQKSPDKRPNWNSKTKVDYVPVVNLQPVNCDKAKIRPTIPKLTKTQSKKDDEEEARNSHSKQKSLGKTFHNTTNKSQEFMQANQRSGQKMPRGRQMDKNDDQNPFQQNIGQIRERPGEIGVLNFKFQQLVKCNTEILASMKQNNQAARDSLKKMGSFTSSNYVEKAGSPRSEHHNSQAASPNERSFVSQSHPDTHQAKIC